MKERKLWNFKNGHKGRIGLCAGLMLLICMLGCAAAMADGALKLPASLTVIEDEAFMGDTSITSVEIPEGTTSIGARAFAQCSNLTEVAIPDSVTSIGEGAFAGCEGLSLHVAEGSAAEAFADQNGINYVYASGTPAPSVTAVPTLEPTPTLLPAEFEYTIKDGYVSIAKYIGNSAVVTIPEKIDDALVVSLSDRAFENCTNLVSVDIPENVTDIGERAFLNCVNLTSVNIPNGVTRIKAMTFYGCRKLENINLPDQLLTIGDGAFMGCSNLASVQIPNTVYSIGEGAFMACSSLTSIVSPESVTSIGRNAFSSCTKLAIVTLPSNITSIAEGLFWGCSSLTRVTVPDSVTELEYGAFSGCFNLTSIYLPEGLKTIGDEAFADCEQLSSISIPESVTTIGTGAFLRCSRLASVSLPIGITSISAGIFEDCGALTSVQIPNTVTSIGVTAFYGCNHLTSLTIPDSVRKIEAGAFVSCTALTAVDLPDNLTSIGERAFENCSSLARLNIPKTVTSIGTNAFNYCGSLLLYVYMDSCAESYAINNLIPYICVDAPSGTPAPTSTPAPISTPTPTPTAPTPTAEATPSDHKGITSEYYQIVKNYSLEGKRYYRAEQIKDYNGISCISGDAGNYRTIYLDENLYPVTDAEVYAKLYTVQLCDDLWIQMCEEDYSAWKNDILVWNEAATGYLQSDLLFKNVGRDIGVIIETIVTSGAKAWDLLLDLGEGTLEDAAVCGQIALINDMTSYAYRVIDYASSDCSLLDESGAYCYEKIIDELQQKQKAYECKESIKQLCVPITEEILKKYNSAWELGAANLLTMFSEMAGSVKPVQFTLSLIVNIIEGDVASLDTLTDFASVLEDEFSGDTLMSGWLASVNNYTELIESAAGINTSDLLDLTENYIYTAEEVSQWELYQVHLLLAQ